MAIGGDDTRKDGRSSALDRPQEGADLGAEEPWGFDADHMTDSLHDHQPRAGDLVVKVLATFSGARTSLSP